MNTHDYKFRDWYIPARMLAALDRYVNQGIRPGSFLTAILANDFTEACMRADDENLRNLPAYAAYLYNELPSACHGSYPKVDAWVDNTDGVRTSSVGGQNAGT